MLKISFRKYLQGLLFLCLSVLSFSTLAQNTLFPDTIRTCQVDSLMLDAGSGYEVYEWSNGYTSQTAWFSFPGLYSVSVYQADTLVFTDEFTILFVMAKIIQSDTLITCGDTLMLQGSDPFYHYLWTDAMEEADSIILWPRESQTWYAEISDPDDPVYFCTDSVFVEVEPIILLDSVIQTSIGCPGEDKAKIKLEVSGGYPPYDYEWPAEAIPLFEDPSFAIGLTDGDKKITITDTIGCFLKDTFNVKAHPLPDLILSANPTDTVYLQKPYINFSYENPLYDSLGVDTFYLNWWEWNFGDSTRSVLLSPTHTYQNTGSFTVVLKFRTFYECEGTDTIMVEVKPVKLKISSVFTPNGDLQNEYFEIWEDTGTDSGDETKSVYNGKEDDFDLSEYYISTRLIIFNRWGEKVFEVDDYQNDWNGEGLADGIYYYILQCEGEFSNDVYKGSVTILTGETF